MIYDSITSEERTAIIDYINLFSDSKKDPNVDLSYILRFWEKEKQHIYEKFNNQLILKWHIEEEAGTDALKSKIETSFQQNYEILEFENKILDIFRHNLNFTEFGTVSYILSPAVLASNSIQDEYRIGKKITLADGNTITLQRNMKPMKIIKKIAESYSIDGFEEFRVTHAECLNKKKISGNFCLSIHPLDYLTLSDNAANWSSCLRWHDQGGGYRQGTIEMMNSPFVVVGYLEDEHKTYDFGYVSKWNSKLWRCLYIVTNNFILSDRSYPYIEEKLTKFGMKKLAEIFDFKNKIKTLPSSCEIENIRIAIDTNAMYNDFEVGYTNYIVFKNQPEYASYVFNISGQAQCISCGDELNVFVEDTNFVNCDNCFPRARCTCCGEAIQPEYICNYDDEYYCEDCFCDLFEYDSLLYDYIPIKDSVRISLDTYPDVSLVTCEETLEDEYDISLALATYDETSEEYIFSKEKCSAELLEYFDRYKDRYSFLFKK